MTLEQLPEVLQPDSPPVFGHGGPAILEKFAAQGASGLVDQSRRLLHSLSQMRSKVKSQMVKLRASGIMLGNCVAT